MSSEPPVEYQMVPVAALKWLNGEGPDPAGFWFGDFPDDHPKPAGQFWWRSLFNAMIAAPPAPGGLVAGWEIDRTTDSPILMYEKCSVIQDDQALYVMSLLNDASEAAAELSRLQSERDNFREAWTTEAQCIRDIVKAAGPRASDHDIFDHIRKLVAAEASLTAATEDNKRLREALNEIQETARGWHDDGYSPVEAIDAIDDIASRALEGKR